MGNRNSASARPGEDNYDPEYLASLPEETRRQMEEEFRSNDGNIEDDETVSVASPSTSNRPDNEEMNDNLDDTRTSNFSEDFDESRSGRDPEEGGALSKGGGEDDEDTVAKSDNDSEGDNEEIREDESDQDDNSDAGGGENPDTSAVDDYTIGGGNEIPEGGSDNDDNDDNSDGEIEDNAESAGDAKMMATSSKTEGGSDNDDNSDGEIEDNAESAGDAKMMATTSKTGGGGNSGLDEPTLQAIKAFLSQKGAHQDSLDEDEVTMNAIKTSRYANERTRYRQNVLEGSDMEEETFYARVYREEESYALSNEFFKSVTNEAQNLAEDENDDTEDFQMDKRTLNWLKRAAGLVRPYDPMKTYHQAYLSEDEDPEGETDTGDKQSTSRRMTRGLARSTRVKRREQRIRIENQGVTTLMEAVLDLEAERGPFVDKQKPQDIYETDGSLSIGGRRSKKHRRHSHGALVAILPLGASRMSARVGRKIKLTRILVNGRHIEPPKRKQGFGHNQYLSPPSKRRRSSLSLSSDGFDSSGSFSTDSSDSDDEDDAFPINVRFFGDLDVETIFHPTTREESSKDPISLDMLDWRRRVLHNNQKQKYSVGGIPELLTKAGMERRLSPWKSLTRGNKAGFSGQLAHYDPRRVMHADDRYASFCKTLMNCLSGGAKRWAQHEFFYGDIDRGWYERNEFASDVAKLGVLPNMKLTRREWSLIRRHIPHRPRRFSQRFVFEQLKQRNRYRSIFRQMQRNPNQSNPLGCDIPPPIRVGTTVTAYNKRLRILHRGTVLFHDARAHGYLIQFERKELGYEFCPDTEVASHGLPEVLVPARESWLHGTSRTGNLCVSEVGTMTYGTSRAPTSESAKRQRSLTSKDEVASWLGIKRRKTGAPDLAPTDLVDKSIEREALISVIAAVETISKRKHLILKTIDTFNGTVSQLRHKKNLSNHDIGRHFAWLVANLQTTNDALRKARHYLRILYGKAFSKTPSSSKKLEQARRSHAIEKAVREDCRCSVGPPSLSIPWASALTLDAQTSAKVISQKLLSERCDWNDCEEEQEESPASDQSLLENRLAAAGSLLFTAEYCCEAAVADTSVSTSCAVEAAFNAGMELFDSTTSNDLYAPEASVATRELKDAVNMLKAELALSSARRRLQAAS